MGGEHDLLVCFATPLESDGMPRAIGGRAIRILETGIGPVNAAFALTRELARAPAASVVVCGIGGAYPGSGLSVGDVVSASSEMYGDLGVDAPEGFLDMRDLGFPVLSAHGGRSPLYNHFPVDFFPTSWRVPFVTCTTCTGSGERAAAIAARTAGAVESMEGAAIVHVARAMDVPVGELRGISNAVGDRDKSRWRIREAAAASRAALIAWIESGGAR